MNQINKKFKWNGKFQHGSISEGVIRKLKKINNYLNRKAKKRRAYTFEAYWKEIKSLSKIKSLDLETKKELLNLTNKFEIVSKTLKTNNRQFCENTLQISAKEICEDVKTKKSKQFLQNANIATEFKEGFHDLTKRNMQTELNSIKDGALTTECKNNFSVRTKYFLRKTCSESIKSQDKNFSGNKKIELCYIHRRQKPVNDVKKNYRLDAYSNSRIQKKVKDHKPEAKVLLKNVTNVLKNSEDILSQIKVNKKLQNAVEIFDDLKLSETTSDSLFYICMRDVFTDIKNMFVEELMNFKKTQQSNILALESIKIKGFKLQKCPKKIDKSASKNVKILSPRKLYPSKFGLNDRGSYKICTKNILCSSLNYPENKKHENHMQNLKSSKNNLECNSHKLKEVNFKCWSWLESLQNFTELSSNSFYDETNKILKNLSCNKENLLDIDSNTSIDNSDITIKSNREIFLNFSRPIYYDDDTNFRVQHTSLITSTCEVLSDKTNFSDSTIPASQSPCIHKKH